MTRTGYDAIRSLAHNIPSDAAVVMGYIDHTDPWTAAEWGRFPHATQVRIARGPTTQDGHVGDCEPGCMWPPSQLVSWVRLRRSAGADPTGYCSTGNWATCKAAFAAAHEPEPHWWVAAYPGSGAQTIPAGAIAHQYQDAGIYDLSTVADYWPGVDGGFDVTSAEQITDIQFRVASMHAGNYLPWGGVAGNPGGDLTWFQQQAKTALAPVLAQLAAIQGALTADEAAILGAVAGVDTDTKAGFAQLATAIANITPGQPPTAAQIAAIEAALAASLATDVSNITLTLGSKS